MTITRDIRRDMADYLPGYYGDSRIVGNILDRGSTEIAGLNNAITDVLDQFYIDTATWGIANWERVCRIPTDETKPYDQRRSVIKSKLRGIGTVTVALIESVAEAYDNGDVTVTEDNANYTVTITYVSTLGVPPNLNDIQSALRDILPAHLAVNFVFKFYLYSDLITSGKTYAQISAMTYGALLNEGVT